MHPDKSLSSSLLLSQWPPTNTSFHSLTEAESPERCLVFIVNTVSGQGNTFSSVNPDISSVLLSLMLPSVSDLYCKSTAVQLSLTEIHQSSRSAHVIHMHVCLVLVETTLKWCAPPCHRQIMCEREQWCGHFQRCSPFHSSTQSENESLNLG